jgi:acetylornithine deacetylase
LEKVIANVNEWIEANQNKGVQLLQKLVQEGSVRGKESSAQAIIIEKCRELGLELDIWEIGDEALFKHSAFCSDRKSFAGNPNVVGVLKGSGGGKSIILNSHIDVVPEGDREAWDDDPYSGKIKEGKLFGRGSTDMKGGTAALLLSLEAMISLGIKLKGDVIFQSVIEEESGGAGTLAAVLKGYKADGAIIPEPTNMKLFLKQQGSMWFRIIIKGKSAHGGTRYEGVNAIDKAIVVIECLRELEKQRNMRIQDPLYDNTPIPVPINIGKINSGQWPSSVPDLCIIEGRMGVAPGETLQEAERELENAIFKLEKQDKWFSEHPPKIEWFGGRWLPGSLEQNHPLMKTLIKSYETILAHLPEIEASPWGTDGGILSNIGDTPVVVFGPGTTEVAHDANEYIQLDQIIQAAKIIALSILSWCEMEKGISEE